MAVSTGQFCCARNSNTTVRNSWGFSRAGECLQWSMTWSVEKEAEKCQEGFAEGTREDEAAASAAPLEKTFPGKPRGEKVGWDEIEVAGARALLRADL